MVVHVDERALRGVLTLTHSDGRRLTIYGTVPGLPSAEDMDDPDQVREGAMAEDRARLGIWLTALGENLDFEEWGLPEDGAMEGFDVRFEDAGDRFDCPWDQCWSAAWSADADGWLWGWIEENDPILKPEVLSATLSATRCGEKGQCDYREVEVMWRPLYVGVDLDPDGSGCLWDSENDPPISLHWGPAQNRWIIRGEIVRLDGDQQETRRPVEVDVEGPEDLEGGEYMIMDNSENGV